MLFKDPTLLVQTLIMYVIIGVLFYLAIVRKFEPLLLLPIAFGMLLANLPGANLFHMDLFIHEDGSPINIQTIVEQGNLIDFLYLGVKLGIYPSLIFLGVGAMTDFSALIANPKSLLMGAAAQFGVFVAFIGAIFLGFAPAEAAAIGIIGGADGPTAILVTKTLAPHLLGAIAIAAYSYMALIPIIQPPFMKLLTTKKERAVVMTTLRPVSLKEKIVFPIMVALVVSIFVPDAAPLIGFLMFGNLLNVSGVTDRLSKTAQNELMNTVTIFLGVSVGATANASNFLAWSTIKIIVLGLCAFCISTIGGLLFGKLMYVVTKGKINPLIGSAGVSAVPMAARVSQVVGQKENPSNFLLMHAMGPNVAGVIGSAVAAGVFLSYFG
ncbi:MAG: sodium ion-translocating decarboxylase subunit beta [Clostridia bacterium]|nr:sodium ion-translocating decarboxylase subunit beta [Clostridia bacterium]